jgi:hypothetical protein
MNIDDIFPAGVHVGVHLLRISCLQYAATATATTVPEQVKLPGWRCGAGAKLAKQQLRPKTILLQEIAELWTVCGKHNNEVGQLLRLTLLAVQSADTPLPLKSATRQVAQHASIMQERCTCDTRSCVKV